MGPDDPPPLPAYEFFSLPLEDFAVTKALHGNNYLPAIVEAADPALGLRRFILPNLTLFPASSPGTESVVRWCVPIDDQSYLE